MVIYTVSGQSNESKAGRMRRQDVYPDSLIHGNASRRIQQVNCSAAKVNIFSVLAACTNADIDMDTLDLQLFQTGCWLRD